MRTVLSCHVQYNAKPDIYTLLHMSDCSQLLASELKATWEIEGTEPKLSSTLPQFCSIASAETCLKLSHWTAVMKVVLLFPANVKSLLYNAQAVRPRMNLRQCARHNLKVPCRNLYHLPAMSMSPLSDPSRSRPSISTCAALLRAGGWIYQDPWTEFEDKLQMA